MSQHREFDFLRPAIQAGEEARDAVNRLFHADESEVVGRLVSEAKLDPAAAERVNRSARSLVARVRERKSDQNALEAFMQEYDLSSEEGVVLMCLAEALLRIPDSETAEKLITDKLSGADWESHLGRSSSILVNASTWGLMLTGKLVTLGEGTQRNLANTLGKMVNRSGDPVIRAAIRQAMRIMGFQYVMGRDIEEALDRAERKKNRAYRYSFDMLGEAALTAPDAERYFHAYCNAIGAIGRRRHREDIFEAPSISVKLSALHPRYEFGQRERVLAELAPNLLELARLAMANDMALTVDAEEADRLMLSLDVFSAVLRDGSLRGWDGFGLAVQTYLKMAPAVIDLLTDLSRETGHRLPVRLVKGAYWDAEIKHAQEQGYSGYPVFTRKASTDVSYIACARRVLGRRQAFYPQFATHNAHTIAIIAEMAGKRLDYEFQRLHGMGEDLYGEVMGGKGYHRACRVYAPVGSHEDLLPYLVRRLLENGSNTSFVNRIVDEKLPVEKVAEDPVEKAAAAHPAPHPSIPLPVALFGDRRRNSSGVNLANDLELARLARGMQAFADCQWEAGPLLAAKRGDGRDGETHAVTEPASGAQIGTVRFVTEEELSRAIADAHEFRDEWDGTPAAERAAVLDRAADLFEANLTEFLALCAREGGRTIEDGVSEVREAADFLRYYAMQARERFAQPLLMPGPTGERNEVSLHGRGVFACISPWNFPLAIFTGQVTAALAAGNTVLAKPAEPTPVIAYRAVQLLHEAGVPRAALQLLPGRGRVVGSALTGDPRIAGVAVTGSTATAHTINRALAAREGAALATLIAETGGQNAMLVDSSALPEQVVQDVIRSAFHSAGQRCSALRVLFLQEDVADKIIAMLVGAMQELVVGDPGQLRTDVGPVINAGALRDLQAHVQRMDSEARLLARAPLDPLLNGTFLAPCAYEIDGIGRLEDEVFGPVLHVIRYRSRHLDRVIDAINGTGYGLTLGVHSRIDRTQRYIARRVKVGNCYVNRAMTGAVVGVQPFGGEGLSGTGPKAGGPHYLLRFATERTLTINTAAVGGNASLLAMEP